MITLSRSQWIWLAWSAVGAGIACAISLFVLDGIPHVQDEVVYQLQARLLTELRLWEVERLPRAAYPFEFVINEAGRRYGIFPNGWPAVLALGTAVGAPWLVNPLLHGLTVFLGARFSARLIGPRGGLFAAPLLALNPGLLLLASSRMSHTLCALLAVIALTCTQKATRAGALGLGFALAGLILTRPLDGLIATSVFLPLAFIQRPVRVWSWCLPVIAAGTLLVLYQNHTLEGSWSSFPQDAYFARGVGPSSLFEWRFTSECNALGFGTERGCFATDETLGHTPQKAWRNTSLNLGSASLLWLGTPFLLPMFIPALFDRRLRGVGAAALALFGALVITYALYWYNGTSYGPRFYHLALPLLLLFAAGGIELVSSSWRHGVVLLYVVLAAFLLRTWTTLPELEGYWGVDDRIVKLKREWSGGPSLILVAAVAPVSRHVDRRVTTGENHNEVSFFRRAMWIEQSDAQLEFAAFQPRLVDEMRRRFSDRETYVLALSADPTRDRLIPIEALGDMGEQRLDLPLP
ncbi:MAG: hypothetical protein JRG89_23335, partial [Deltaproteobacteria bacterium]|nr:hypothetical protein [Deltaproteobacteria bacterium]